MSYAVMPLSEWQKIVNSVRSKTGNTNPLLSTQLAAEIDSITIASTDMSSFAQHIQGTKREVTAEELAGITQIRAYAFTGSPITSIDIPDGVTQIGNYSFNGCSQLVSVTVPDGVINFGQKSFLDCKSLQNINIPNTTTTIGSETFRGCSSLTKMVVPNSVTKMNESAFYLCTSLEVIVLGRGINKIGSYNFRYCEKLMETVCLAETPPTLDGNAFAGVPEDMVIKVPAASVEAYKAATNWSARADYIIALTDEEVAQYGN